MIGADDTAARARLRTAIVEAADEAMGLVPRAVTLRMVADGKGAVTVNPVAVARIAAEVLRLRESRDARADRAEAELDALRAAAREWVAADDAVTAASSLEKLDAMERRVVAGQRLRALVGEG